MLLFVGFITGTLGSFLGAGGVFVQVPLLIYLFGFKTVVAVGTSVFGILIFSICACFSHAVEGNVDILWATARAHVALVSLSVAFELMARLLEIYILSFFSQTLLVLTVVSVAFFVIISTFPTVKRNSES